MFAHRYRNKNEASHDKFGFARHPEDDGEDTVLSAAGQMDRYALELTGQLDSYNNEIMTKWSAHLAHVTNASGSVGFVIFVFCRVSVFLLQKV